MKALILVIAMLVPTIVAAQDLGIRASAERLAEEIEIQANSGGETRRSMGRTWTGIALIAGGSFLATRTEETCIPNVVIAGISVPGRCGLDKRWNKRTGAIGLGMAGAGALLATIWSEVPLARRATVAAMPGELSIGTSYTW